MVSSASAIYKHMHIERGEDKVAVNHIAVITGLIGTFPESKTPCIFIVKEGNESCTVSQSLVTGDHGNR